MSSIDFLSCPGQLDHMSEMTRARESSQDVPVHSRKVPKLPKKQEAILVTPQKSPKYVSFSSKLHINKSTFPPQQPSKQQIFGSRKTGTWYASWASRVAVSMLKIMSFTCGGAESWLTVDLRCTLQNAHLYYLKGMQPVNKNGKKNLRSGKPPTVYSTF